MRAFSRAYGYSACAESRASEFCEVLAEVLAVVLAVVIWCQQQAISSHLINSNHTTIVSKPVGPSTSQPTYSLTIIDPEDSFCGFVLASEHQNPVIKVSSYCTANLN